MFKCHTCQMEFRPEDQFLYGQQVTNSVTLERFPLVKDELLMCAFCVQNKTASTADIHTPLSTDEAEENKI